MRGPTITVPSIRVPIRRLENLSKQRIALDACMASRPKYGFSCAYSTRKLLVHLDGRNPNVKLHKLTTALKDVSGKPLVSANAYLGARGIMAAL
jgi:hypothetical protein